MEYPIINAFSNSVRLKLLCCLSKNPKNVNELISNCGLAQSAVSQHLNKLKKAGLVTSKKNGRFVFYRLNNRSTGKIANLLSNYILEVN